jgi:hypothetical protein
MDQNSQGRRPHYHRGRRGPDRRGQERRQPQAPAQASSESPRDGDVEQIMREIRARISQRHGIDLSPQQIQELAARRLEAILDPRSVKPSLLEQMRRSAATLPDEPARSPGFTFEDSTLYETHRGLLRAVRRLLNPILKLFFNPTPIAQALNTQARLNAEAGALDTERDRRQAEWNALHYNILQRLVTENSRLSLELQDMALRVESLGAKVDFNERRVRSMETTAPAQRPPQAAARVVAEPPTATTTVAPDSGGAPPAGDSGGDGSRRRRRRRRGRRAGGTFADTATAGTAGGSLAEGDDDSNEPDENVEEPAAVAEAAESDTPRDIEQPIDAPIAVEAPVAPEPHPPFPPAPAPPAERIEAPVATAEADTPPPTVVGIEQPPLASTPPDDPGHLSVPPADPGPQDR